MTWTLSHQDAAAAVEAEPGEAARAAAGRRSAAEADALGAVARAIRRRILVLSHRARSPHIGSCLSCVDILVAAYWSAIGAEAVRSGAPGRDRFILSKGHAALAWYATLEARGLLEPGALETFGQAGSRFGQHPGAGTPGIELATGSLGHGLSVGAGLALGARMQGSGARVVVVLSDGECNEGSSWEAAMFAAGKGLGNLTAVIDFNRWQATGRSCETLALEPLARKWQAFGWRAGEVDGHDLHALVRALGATRPGQPSAIVAHTTKGKGISFMEDDNDWHYATLNDRQLAQALEELDA